MTAGSERAVILEGLALFPRINLWQAQINLGYAEGPDLDSDSQGLSCRAAMPRKTSQDQLEQLANVDLTGLAKAWEKDDDIRSSALQHGCLLAWCDPKTIGLVSLKSLKLNARVLIKLLEIYLPKVADNKSCYVDTVKLEVGSL